MMARGNRSTKPLVHGWIHIGKVGLYVPLDEVPIRTTRPLHGEWLIKSTGGECTRHAGPYNHYCLYNVNLCSEPLESAALGMGYPIRPRRDRGTLPGGGLRRSFRRLSTR